jgi:uncharacterized membrane protein YdcZ (DUF606 family)
MEMARVWPVICQYGVGAVMLGIGMWCGIRSGYLDMKNREDRNLLWILVGGFVAMLVIVSAFTFWLPFAVGEAVQ